MPPRGTDAAIKKETYRKVMETLFFGEGYCHHLSDTARKVMTFSVDDVFKAHADVTPARCGNVADVTFAFRSGRQPLPDAIRGTAPSGWVWTLKIHDRGTHAFMMVKDNQISFGKGRSEISILDATPEVVKQFVSFRDEQALLSIVRYNRLVDLFLGMTAYSIQNHMKTSIDLPEGRSTSIEIDEVYVGMDPEGVQYLIPVQARRNKEDISPSQIENDILFCKQQIQKKFPGMRYKSLAVKFTHDNDVHRIAFGEFEIQNGEVRMRRDQLYVLRDLTDYRAVMGQTRG